MTRFLLLSDTYGPVERGRPLWREDGSVFYNCCCLRQRSHSQVRVPRGSWPHFTVSDLRVPQPGGPGPCIYIPQEQGCPVINPGTGFGILLKVKVTLRLTVSQSVCLGIVPHLGHMTRNLAVSSFYITLGRTWWKTCPLSNNRCIQLSCIVGYLTMDCLSKNCISVETCLLSRCLAADVCYSEISRYLT
jgi:hypothetical protein